MNVLSNNDGQQEAEYLKAVQFMREHPDLLALAVVHSGQGNVPDNAWLGTDLSDDDESLRQLAPYFKETGITAEDIIRPGAADTRNISTHLLVTAVQRSLYQRFLKKTGIKPSQVGVYAPHSLGLLGAAEAIGNIDLQQLGGLAVPRATELDLVAVNRPSGLVAILNATNLAEAVSNADEECYIGLDNAPGQQVMATTRHEDGSLYVPEGIMYGRRGKSVAMNARSGFHSPKAKSTIAKDSRFLAAAQNLQAKPGHGLMISNVTGGVVDNISNEMIQQMVSRVRFREGLELLWKLGIRDFAVFGLQKSLKAAIEQTLGKEVRIHTITIVGDIEKLPDDLAQQIPTFGQVLEARGHRAMAAE